MHSDGWRLDEISVLVIVAEIVTHADWRPYSTGRCQILLRTLKAFKRWETHIVRIKTTAIKRSQILPPIVPYSASSSLSYL